MSSTNLTDGKSSLCFFMINCDRNYLKDGEKAGDASNVNQEDAKNLSINLGVSDMKLSVNEISINDKGRRGNNTQRKDMEKMEYKVERMKKINAAKVEEKETKKETKPKNRDSETNEHEDR